ncbi:hypothetical protein PAMP_011501 [Pampus punctatissimus]
MKSSSIKLFINPSSCNNTVRSSAVMQESISFSARTRCTVSRPRFRVSYEAWTPYPVRNGGPGQGTPGCHLFRMLGVTKMSKQLAVNLSDFVVDTVHGRGVEKSHLGPDHTALRDHVGSDTVLHTRQTLAPKQGSLSYCTLVGARQAIFSYGNGIGIAYYQDVDIILQ